MSDSEPQTPQKGPPPADTTDDTDAPESDAPQKARSRSRSAAGRLSRQKNQITNKQQQAEKRKEMRPPEEEPEAEEVNALPIYTSTPFEC